MPTYGYRCQACGAEFDVVQRMTDPAEASCPSCHGAGRRLFFPVGIAFKGQGFYKTDSRAATATASTSSESAASNGSSAGSSNGSTAKDAGSTATPTPPASSKGSSGSSAATT